VSTDLDGTLLDHYTYQWEAALPSLQRLATLNIPVIINTSKTYEEVVALQQAMSLTSPFIVENGSAVFLPKSQYPKAPAGSSSVDSFWQYTLGCQRSRLYGELQAVRDATQWQFESFTDMSVERVVEVTGLTQNNAALALKRRFSEPLLWNDTQTHYQRFVERLQSRNLHVIKGGRFVHVLGQTDKGKAIAWCRDFQQSINNLPTKLIALGDGPNDIDMLNIADYAVVVRSPTHDYPTIAPLGKALHTQGYGPIGWHEAISTLIQ
jgi:HAD-superfamily hydrolase, subfamily IIB/mannosyl-3-phosphoglycerate phosphatase family